MISNKSAKSVRRLTEKDLPADKSMRYPGCMLNQKGWRTLSWCLWAMYTDNRLHRQEKIRTIQTGLNLEGKSGFKIKPVYPYYNLCQSTNAGRHLARKQDYMHRLQYHFSGNYQVECHISPIRASCLTLSHWNRLCVRNRWRIYSFCFDRRERAETPGFSMEYNTPVITGWYKRRMIAIYQWTTNQAFYPFMIMYEGGSKSQGNF